MNGSPGASNVSTPALGRAIADWLGACRNGVGKLKDPKQRSLARRALAAFERAQLANAITSHDLAEIVEAATDRYKTVWELGTLLLHWLAKHPATQDALRTMFGSSSSAVRCRVISLVRSSLAPQAFLCELIRAGLRDKSLAVRGTSAEMARWLGLKELLPDLRLRQAQTIETHAATREYFEFEIALLDRGHLLRREDGKATWLDVRLDSGAWLSVPLSDEKLKDRGLDSLLADARSQGETSMAIASSLRLLPPGPQYT